VEENLDDFVWVWDSLESAWKRCLCYTAETFIKLWPDRYGKILNDDAIPQP